MNKGNYLDKAKYPWASEDFDFVQEMINLVQQLTSLGGVSNYILSGCIKMGSTYSEGILILNGEILPFLGGVAVTGTLPGGTGPADWIEIVETQDDVQVYDTLYADVRRRRHVACGGNAISILSFERISTLHELKQLITSLTSTVSGKVNITQMDDALLLKENLPIKRGYTGINYLNAGETMSFDVTIPTRTDVLYGVLGSIWSETPSIIWSFNKYYNKVTFYCQNTSNIQIGFRFEYTIYNH